MYGNFCSSKFFFLLISVFKKLNQFNWFRIIEIRFLVKSSLSSIFNRDIYGSNPLFSYDVSNNI